MGLMQWIFKGKTASEPVLTDEMRAQALETRRLQSQVLSLQKQLQLKTELAEMRQMIKGIGESSNHSGSEEVFLTALLPLLLGGRTSPPNATPEGLPSGVSTMNPEQANQVAAMLSSKLPDEALFYLQNMSDQDVIAVKNLMVQNAKKK